MAKLHDAEFGDITVRRQALARQVSLRIAPNGQLVISLPSYAPLMAAKVLLKSSRGRIRALLNDYHQRSAYTHDQSIGKSHHLLIQSGPDLAVRQSGTRIILTVPDHLDAASPIVQQQLKPAIVRALRKEAKAYLPRRLEWLAEQHGFQYKAVKLTHASSRWGSCSSRGTISLNIALMMLPFELLDYVLLHELAHTREMNHSPHFWQEVARVDPAYQVHRKALKRYTPHI